ncbi:MAG TPA: type I-D CRISPR-associated protein Cas7/Csc2 [Ardenticatenaceae bacterium]|nr:type I-D CRISPR-associated protein Cas7/Csc2 [Ardenticatenaceae bacterium]
MSVLDRYTAALLPRYHNYPQGRYVTLLLVRRVESEAIFRTEGSGEPLSKEFVHAGLAENSPVIPRVVISKRKQTAVERRTGRELLRRHGLLRDTRDGICALNRNNPCGACIDCMLYGYAAGGGGAQKSRVITDDAFSLQSAAVETAVKTFNALFDNSTMRDPETGRPSTSIGEDEYVRPETMFMDIETLKDVTPGEMRYVLGNILRSTRYGAISSRIGKVKNVLAGVVFSDTELFSNLELTQAVYDELRADKQEPDFPLSEGVVVRAARTATERLLPRVVGQVRALSGDEVGELVSETAALYGDDEAVAALLTETMRAYPQASQT